MLVWSVVFLVRDCSSLLGCQVLYQGTATPVGPHAATVRLWPRALGLALPCLVTPRGSVPDAHRLFLGVRDP
jgi:hypothetical protein